MANYTKLTNFEGKDELETGNPAKIIKASELDAEFNAIATMSTEKADNAGPTFTGVPKAPTATTGTDTTQIATTAFVNNSIEVAIPVGALMLMAFGSPTPAGYLVADGSAIPRAGYPALFSVIGTTFGEGDGSTTFNVPNLTSEANTEYYIKY